MSCRCAWLLPLYPLFAVATGAWIGVCCLEVVFLPLLLPTKLSTISELASANIALAHSFTINQKYRTSTATMFSRQILMASAFAVFANAQTIETSSASSVAASSTVAQSMPPAATQGFNIGNVTQTELCRSFVCVAHRALLIHSTVNFCQAQLNTCPQICGGAASMNQCDPVRSLHL